jgi:hypothetical protein
MLEIEGWGSLSRVRNVVQKIGENNQKAKKIGRNVSQTPTLTVKHDKMQAQWALEVPLKSMLERV